MLPFDPCPPTPNCHIEYVDVPPSTEVVASKLKTVLVQFGAYDLQADENGYDCAIDVFVFTDDLKIRIFAEGTGTRLWIRSSSRVGQWDLGVNKWRVHSLIRLLKHTFP
jgi:uncharacterized protein (DUF1499 family)